LFLLATCGAGIGFGVKKKRVAQDSPLAGAPVVGDEFGGPFASVGLIRVFHP
jgi:hypothetical protein